MDSHHRFRYSSQHSHFRFVDRSSFSRLLLPKTERSSTENIFLLTHRFGKWLSPVHLQRKKALPVSYYTLFKFLLPLSEYLGCLGFLTSFATEPLFWGLSGWSGLFPF